MPTPTLHELGDSFDERNVCLYVTLGTISYLRRFKQLLREYGAEEPTTEGKIDQERAGDEDTSLYAALGLISVSETMMHYLPASRTAASSLRSSNSRDRSPSVERLAIRRLLR